MFAQLMYVIKGHKIPAEYSGLEEKRVAVVCVSDSASYGPDTLTYTVSNAVSIKLSQNVNKIEIVQPREIEKWIDMNGWDQHEFVELGKAVNADVVVAIEIAAYSIKDGSTLFKGQTDLSVTAFDVATGNVVFNAGPELHVFPKHGRPAIQTTDRQFEAYYLAKLTDSIARHFYPTDQMDSVAEDAMAIH